MQCPSCGFENMPGPERCCVCNHELVSTPPTGGMYPPRVRDRSFWERTRWWIAHNPFLTVDRERTAGQHIPTRPGMLRIGVRETLWAIASIVPGVGHICVLRRPKTGWGIIAGCVVALLTAVPLYKYAVSDLLVYGIIAASAFSMWSVIRWFQRDRQLNGMRFMTDVGIALVVTAVYFGSYTLLRMAINPWVMTPRVAIDPHISQIAQNDNLLVLKTRELNRGDIVIGETTRPQLNYDVPLLGPVVGVPGDRIDLRECVYINGSPTDVKYASGTRGEMQPPHPISLTLGAGSYWVPPMSEWQIGDPAEWLRTGVIVRYSVIGRVVAVTNPPEHRRWIH